MFLNTGNANARVRVLLAHGAGAAMTSPFLEQFAALLAARNIAVSRFEFAYMAARRSGGARRPPPKAESLKAEYIAAVSDLATPASTRLIIGGKSMGGRVASMVADTLYESGVIAGLVCLGYPFHPPNKSDQLRTGHLTGLATPALFVQGERDPFGTRDEVVSLTLSPAIHMHWVVDGDHDLGPRGGKGLTRRGNLETAADAVARFAQHLA